MQHFIMHFIIHSWICVTLLSTTLSRVRKSSNVLIFISSIYIPLYLLGYGKKIFTLENNIIYILIYLFIIGYYIYVIFRILDIKKKKVWIHKANLRRERFCNVLSNILSDELSRISLFSSSAINHQRIERIT